MEKYVHDVRASDSSLALDCHTVVRVIKCLYGCMYVTLGWKTAKEQNGTATATTERIHNYRLPQ